MRDMTLQTAVTLMLSCSLTPSAAVLALPLVLTPREMTPLLVGGTLCSNTEHSLFGSDVKGARQWFPESTSCFWVLMLLEGCTSHLCVLAVDGNDMRSMQARTELQCPSCLSCVQEHDRMCLGDPGKHIKLYLGSEVGLLCW